MNSELNSYDDTSAAKDGKKIVEEFVEEFGKKNIEFSFADESSLLGTKAGENSQIYVVKFF